MKAWFAANANRVSRKHWDMEDVTCNISMPMGAYPSQQSPLHSDTFGAAQQSMPFFDLMQQQHPYMQQYSHMQQVSRPSMSYQSSRSFEEHQQCPPHGME